MATIFSDFSLPSENLEKLVLALRSWLSLVWNETNAQAEAQASVPVIDMSKPSEEVAEAMVKACEEHGFFKVFNHGVSLDLIAAMETQAREFFALPLSQKERGGLPDPYGYGNRTIGPNGDVGWIEYLLLRCHPPHIHQLYNAISPHNCTEFSSTVKSYIEATRKLSCKILELLAQGMGLPTTVFSGLIENKENDSVFRLNHYPPCPDPSGCMGFAEHSDPQMITVLRSNDTAGLQILSRDGEWVTLYPDTLSFSINVGDCLQVLTNGRFKSVRHRAVANSLQSRISMVFFGAPALHQILQPSQQLVGEANPLLYRPFAWSEYKKSVYSKKLGQTPLDDYRIDSKEWRMECHDSHA